jgi:hypothetical protein
VTPRISPTSSEFSGQRRGRGIFRSVCTYIKHMYNFHMWERLLKQQTAITVYHLPAGGKQISVFRLQQTNGSCRFLGIYKYIRKTELYTYIIYIYIHSRLLLIIESPLCKLIHTHIHIHKHTHICTSYIYVYFLFKRKKEAQSFFHNPFTVYSL